MAVLLGLVAVGGLRALAFVFLVEVEVGEPGSDLPAESESMMVFYVVWGLSMLSALTLVTGLVTRWAEDERPRALRYAAVGVACLALWALGKTGTELADGAALTFSAALLWGWSYRVGL